MESTQFVLAQLKFSSESLSGIRWAQFVLRENKWNDLSQSKITSYLQVSTFLRSHSKNKTIDNNKIDVFHL